MAAAFATAILLDDDADIEAHQRANICSQTTVSGGHQNAFPDPGHAHGDLLDPRVEGAGSGIDTLEQLDFFSAADDFQRVVRAIQLSHILSGERLHRAVLSGTEIERAARAAWPNASRVMALL